MGPVLLLLAVLTATLAEDQFTLYHTQKTYDDALAECQRLGGTIGGFGEFPSGTMATLPYEDGEKAWVRKFAETDTYCFAWRFHSSASTPATIGAECDETHSYICKTPEGSPTAAPVVEEIQIDGGAVGKYILYMADKTHGEAKDFCASMGHTLALGYIVDHLRSGPTSEKTAWVDVDNQCAKANWRLSSSQWSTGGIAVGDNNYCNERHPVLCQSESGPDVSKFTLYEDQQTYAGAYCECSLRGLQRATWSQMKYLNAQFSYPLSQFQGDVWARSDYPFNWCDFIYWTPNGTPTQKFNSGNWNPQCYQRKAYVCYGDQASSSGSGTSTSGSTGSSSSEWGPWSHCPPCDAGKALQWRYKRCKITGDKIGSFSCPQTDHLETRECTGRPKCSGTPASVSVEAVQQTMATSGIEIIETTINTALKVNEGIRAMRGISDMGKFAAFLGPVGAVIGGLTSVVDILFTFMDSEQDQMVQYMDQKFKEMGTQFDMLNSKLDKWMETLMAENCREKIADYVRDIRSVYEDYYLAYNASATDREFFTDLFQYYYKDKDMDSVIKYFLEAMYSTQGSLGAICRDSFWNIVKDTSKCDFSLIDHYRQQVDLFALQATTIYTTYHTTVSPFNSRPTLLNNLQTWMEPAVDESKNVEVSCVNNVRSHIYAKAKQYFDVNYATSDLADKVFTLLNDSYGKYMVFTVHSFWANSNAEIVSVPYGETTLVINLQAAHNGGSTHVKILYGFRRGSEGLGDSYSDYAKQLLDGPMADRVKDEKNDAFDSENMNKLCKNSNGATKAPTSGVLFHAKGGRGIFSGDPLKQDYYKIEQWQQRDDRVYEWASRCGDTQDVNLPFAYKHQYTCTLDDVFTGCAVYEDTWFIWSCASSTNA